MNMMMLALAMLLQAPPTAPTRTPNWRMFLGGAGTGSIIYLDMASVRRTGDTANAWLHLINDSPTADGIKSMSMQLSIDCQNHTSLLLEAYAYGPTGAYVNGASYGTIGRVPRTAAPGSDDARLEQMVCTAAPARS